MYPLYRLFGYLPFGKVITGRVPTAKYKQAQVEISRLNYGQLNQDILIKLAKLQLEVILERVQIHVFGYREFHDWLQNSPHLTE